MDIEIPDRFADVSSLRQLSINYAKGEISFLEYRHARTALLQQAVAEKTKAVVSIADIDMALAEIQREKTASNRNQTSIPSQHKPLWFLLFALGFGLVLLGIVLTI